MASAKGRGDEQDLERDRLSESNVGQDLHQHQARKPKPCPTVVIGEALPCDDLPRRWAIIYRMALARTPAGTKGGDDNGLAIPATVRPGDAEQVDAEGEQFAHSHLGLATAHQSATYEGPDEYSLK